MQPVEKHPMDEDTDYRQYIAIVLHYWWVVGIVFLVVLGVSIYISLQGTAQYQTSVRLLINTRIADDLIGDDANIPFTGVIAGSRRPSYIFSDTTLSALATRADLVEDIIFELDLRDGSGQMWTEGAVKAMLSPEVSIGESTADNPTVPLLTMTVSGTDSIVVKGIADTWSALFMDRFSELLNKQATDSYNFVNSRHAIAEEKLDQVVRQKEAVLVENSINRQGRELVGLEYSLKSSLASDYQNDELELSRAFLGEQKSIFLVKSAQIQIDEAEYGFLVEELTVPQGSYNGSQVIYERMTNRKAELEYDIKTQKILVVEYEKLIEESQRKADAQHSKYARVMSDLQRLDREIEIQRYILDKRSNQLIQAEVVLDVLPRAVTLIEPASEPSLPPESGRSKMVIGVVLGIILGVLAAFAVHYSRNLSTTREFAQSVDVKEDLEDS